MSPVAAGLAGELFPGDEHGPVTASEVVTKRRASPGAAGESSFLTDASPDGTGRSIGVRPARAVS